MTIRKAASLRPDQLSTGGFPTDQNLLVMEARAVVWDKNEDGTPRTVERNGKEELLSNAAVRVVVRDEEGVQSTHFISAGTTEFLMPVDDPEKEVPQLVQEGYGFIPQGRGRGVSDRSNLGIVVKEMQTCGYPLDRFHSNVAVLLEGMYAYWQMKPIPGRQNQQGGESRVAVPTKIHVYPWQQPANWREASQERGAGATTTTPPYPSYQPGATPPAPPSPPPSAPPPAPPIAATAVAAGPAPSPTAVAAQDGSASLKELALLCLKQTLEDPNIPNTRQGLGMVVMGQHFMSLPEFTAHPSRRMLPWYLMDEGGEFVQIMGEAGYKFVEVNGVDTIVAAQQGE